MGLKEDTESLMTLECKKEAGVLVEEAKEAREGRRVPDYLSDYRVIAPDDMEILIRAGTKTGKLNEIIIDVDPIQYRSRVIYKGHNFETTSVEPLSIREIFKS